ncbi:BaiN/RdsA family NAD(P)/FAD-dependent oxidoreductase [Alkalibacter mobilis]|uniref:NAD(P)/FAD-dependent oxidoreductase n=1 Tax=Alkalibacter mobilis TaxID=2787712 RepID=UPI00189C5BC3|nr:NAD(P)/FAD-dependent oxidoreductase [Alkalibacter mobilis]MBF7097629.1 NAD(P)/FAD-dependent oxidoreductase [Alkalibacter mobilis]
MSKVIVIGGGPAGMIAAGKAASLGNEVTLVEKNEKLGKKLFITGKGRCNFTNACDTQEIFDYIVTNKKFLYSAIYSFSNWDVIRFFNELGLKEKVERGGRVFPASDKSSDVIKALIKYLDLNNVDVRLNTEVEDILVDKKHIVGIRLKGGQVLNCDKLILATGGLTYEQTGSTGDGFKFASKLGHNVLSGRGALIPLVSEEPFIKSLQGLSLKNVEVSLYEGSKKIKSEFGEMLFTHFGLSGPIILTMSSYMKERKKYQVEIDLKPALNFEKLDKRIIRDFEKYSNKILRNSLDELLPQRLIPVIIQISGLDGEKRVNQISKDERQMLCQTIKAMKIKITGKASLNLGIITSGGVDTKEIDPSTMESKMVKGLYFAGEVIDTDALTGGYNLQIAFSTGFLAGSE